MPIDHQEFLAHVETEFPTILSGLSEHGGDSLHLKVAAIREATEAALDAGKLWLAERHFRFIERILPKASPELANAIEISYLEDLALGDWTEARYLGIKERMPSGLRTVLIGHDRRWR